MAIITWPGWVPPWRDLRRTQSCLLSEPINTDALYEVMGDAWLLVGGLGWSLMISR